MSISAVINSTTKMGGGLGAFTAYKMDVTYQGKTWALFRRYSQFAKLHESLEAIFGKETLEKFNFPEKTVRHQSTSVINARKSQLQQYMNSILTLGDIEQQACILEFFDVRGKGISGAARELGAKQLLLETFADVKPYLSVVEFWCTSYVVLSKAGSLYVLRSLYDSTTDPIVVFNVNGGGGNNVHVHSRSGSRIIDLVQTSTNTKLRIRMNSDAEVANWLRTISDFTTQNAPSRESVQQQNAEARAAAKKEAQQQAQQQRQQNTVEIHANGTGHTEDELSQLYGV